MVDDAPINLELLVGLLEEKYEVAAASTGDAALQIAQSTNPPDLILLDIVMPGKDGREVCRMLKADIATAHIPIVFFSGKASDEECDHCMELGGIAYLKKPVDAVSLFSICEIILPNKVDGVEQNIPVSSCKTKNSENLSVD
ncbi:response regulator [Desulforhopalus singaporensis]|uniref:response regulator n=1 Tax=Desulforhopalus singaporensis TaxID=91360 RepID=UPI001C40B3C0|nr:response regulator [Desulforhopalus singaporensis]